MQLILRNFITILKRFKTASILNVLGLSTAFAAFLIILMQVRYEQSFDKFHSKAERIYRLEAQDEEAGRTFICLYPVAPANRRVRRLFAAHRSRSADRKPE